MTKHEERVLLGKIAELIDSADPDGYIRHSFDGVVAMCAENIDNDYWNSMPDRIEYRDRQISELRENMQKNEKLVAERDKNYEAQIEVLKRDCENWERNAHEASELFAEKDAEIAALKALLCDSQIHEIPVPTYKCSALEEQKCFLGVVRMEAKDGTMYVKPEVMNAVHMGEVSNELDKKYGEMTGKIIDKYETIMLVQIERGEN